MINGLRGSLTRQLKLHTANCLLQTSMHRNTKTLTIVLLLTAALLLGVRISNLLSGRNEQPLSSSSPSNLPNTQFPGGPTKSFVSTYCGVTFDYPVDMTLNESTNAARLTKLGSNETIDVACGQNLPKPPLPKDKIETATVAGQLATVYHDKLTKDGSPIDVVILTQPTKKLEIALFGFGETFIKLLKSVRFIQ